MRSYLLLAIVILSLVFHSYLPIAAKSFLYAVSLSVKEGLLFTLPFIIFFFILNSIITLQSNALKLLSLMVAMICISNFTSTWIAYGLGNMFDDYLHHIKLYKNAHNITQLNPSWEFSLPQLINNEISIIAALVLGTLIAFIIPKVGSKISAFLVKIIDVFINKLLSPIVPIFIAGFMIKLSHDQILLPIIKHYLFIFLIIFSSSISYVMIWHLIILRCVGVFSALRNLVAPLITGFSTMSSMMALPLLVTAVENNIKEKKLLQPIVAPITNFHLVGDCFAIPILALTIVTTFGQSPIDAYQYFMFSIYFVISKFAVAAVPGGGILVMLPVLKSTLGFSDAMLSLITTLYVMLDSIITPLNIFGNSALSMLIAKTYRRVFSTE